MTLAGDARIESARLSEGILEAAIPLASLEEDLSSQENLEMRLVSLLEKHQGNVSEVARIINGLTRILVTVDKWASSRAA